MMSVTTCCKLDSVLSVLTHWDYRAVLTLVIDRFREAAICEAQYPYMRYDNQNMQFNPDRDYFGRPRLDRLDMNAHLEIYQRWNN